MKGYIEITLDDAFKWWIIEWERCTFIDFCERIKKAGFIIV